MGTSIHKLWSRLLGAALLLSCTGDVGDSGVQGDDGLNGISALVNVGSEPAGANCSDGGQRIETGLDDNGNGMLDTDEVDQTTYVCDGPSGGVGQTSLVSVSAEAAGANCPDGGQRIDQGIDDNGDGTLDAGEVDQSVYVCNGDNGLTTLLVLTDEPDGLNCPAGGQRVDAGLDDNENGVLDAAEIDETAFICNLPVIGSAVFATGTPTIASVLDMPEECYFYGNNLMNGIWHRNSDLIIAGHYQSDGYWSHPAGASGYANAPDNDTGTQYARIVQVPNTESVIRAGANQFSSPANTVAVGTIDGSTGALSNFAPAVFSDGFTGDCNLVSSSESEFLCYDGNSILVYSTTAGSANLTLVDTVTLSQQPANTCSASCYGGTFAWDGSFYYFANNGGSNGSRDYVVYDPSGTFVGQFTAGGNGGINSIYFDWSKGAYSTHDGFGGRSSSALNFVPASGIQGDDSHCYSLSATHQAPSD